MCDIMYKGNTCGFLTAEFTETDNIQRKGKMMRQ